jgi:hypothetical protein
MPDLRVEVSHSHPALCDGFHSAEDAHRWTDGLARLPEVWLRPFPGDFTLELHLAQSGLQYRVPPQAASAAAAARGRAAHRVNSRSRTAPTLADWVNAVRPSRRVLRTLLRMTFFLMPSIR